METGKTKYLAFIVCLVALAAHIWMYCGFTMDDAFISFRFINQWAAGNGLVFNAGERVEGYSNFLWILMLTPFHRAGIDLAGAAKVMGIVFAFATLVLTWHFSRGLSPTGAAPLLLAAISPFSYWAGSGLETAQYAFLVTAACYLFLQEEEKGKGWFSGILYGLVAVARPEGLVFAVAAGSYRAALYALTGGRTRKQDGARAAAVAGLFIPALAFRLVYYGQLLPNTVTAKSMGLHLRPLLEGAYYCFVSLQAAGGFFFLALTAFLAAASGPNQRKAWFIILTIGLYWSGITINGGDWMPNARFAAHVAPLAFILAHIGLDQLVRLKPETIGRTAVTAIVLGQAFFLGGISVIDWQQVASRKIDQYALFDKQLDYMKEKLEPGDAVAVFNAGYLSYRLPADVRVIDMVGLADGHISRLSARLPGGILGRGDGFGKWDNEYVLASNPRFVEVMILGRNPDGSLITAFTGTTELVNDPRFRERYKLVMNLGYIAGALYERTEP